MFCLHLGTDGIENTFPVPLSCSVCYKAVNSRSMLKSAIYMPEYTFRQRLFSGELFNIFVHTSNADLGSVYFNCMSASEQLFLGVCSPVFYPILNFCYNVLTYLKPSVRS